MIYHLWQQQNFPSADSTKYWGHTLDKDDHCAAIRDVSPMRKIIAPTCVSGLNRVLGLLVQHNGAIPCYWLYARPLHNLTCKGMKWDWSPESNASFAKLHQAQLR